jgi:hypothetical protein
VLGEIPEAMRKRRHEEGLLEEREVVRDGLEGAGVLLLSLDLLQGHDVEWPPAGARCTVASGG